MNLAEIEAKAGKLFYRSDIEWSDSTYNIPGSFTYKCYLCKDAVGDFFKVYSDKITCCLSTKRITENSIKVSIASGRYDRVFLDAKTAAKWELTSKCSIAVYHLFMIDIRNFLESTKRKTCYVTIFEGNL